jgi:hypothetical protein
MAIRSNKPAEPTSPDKQECGRTRPKFSGSIVILRIAKQLAKVGGKSVLLPKKALVA